ncbi:MAG: dienelactone hydrolase family protein [Limisphaerales bacterium]
MKRLLLFLIAASNLIAAEDPVAEALEGHLTSSVQVFLDHHRDTRRYKNSHFPLNKAAHDNFKKGFIGSMTRALNLEKWVVRNPKGKASPVANRFRDQVVERKEIHGVSVEIHAVTIEPTGLVVPMVVCLPIGEKPVPGVATFSGHSQSGLHDMVVNLNSYQQGVAIRLAQAGFVSIAVEKVDTGYLSRHGSKGVDEKEIATLLLGHQDVLRSHQLRACIAAVEILATHPGVDEKRIGVTGVSLGGWLAVQTAMFNDRVAAVADFGRKTRTVATGMTAKNYRGQGDLCHLIPGMFALGGRNLHPLVIAPLPMLASHGIKDKGSHAEHMANFRELGEKQYAELGAAENYTYLIHDGGDTMPSADAISWFNRIFEQ